MHSVPGGYASVLAGYDKIVEVMLKFLEVAVLFQVVIQYITSCRYIAALAANHDKVMIIIKPMNDVRMDRGSAILVCN